MVEHLYNSQQQKNDFVSFHQSIILVSFMTLFINLLAVPQRLTTMYKENDYVPNSTILGVYFFDFILFCFTRTAFGLLLWLWNILLQRALSCTEQLSQCGAQDIYCACLYTFNVFSLFYFLSLPSATVFFRPFDQSIAQACIRLYIFGQFAVCVHSEVIILKEWRDNEIKKLWW